MYRFTHIEAFKSAAHHARKRLDPFSSDPALDPKITFRGTVKLHGTNAGVQFTKDGLVVQSRKRVITPEDDNYGFARFVHDNAEHFLLLEEQLRDLRKIPTKTPVVVYGEWIGPGIQKGVAVETLDERQWVLFAAAELHGSDPEDKFYRDIAGMDEPVNEQIRSVLEIATKLVTMDFSDELSVQAGLEKIDAWTSEYEDLCPWGLHMGVEGIGEGIVWTPMFSHFGDSDLFFKTKGDKHKGKPKSKPVRTSVTPEQIESETAFIEMAVTDYRLNQGLEHLKEMGHPLAMKSMREFLSWVGGDVKRECAMEIEANNLDWKRLSKLVTQKAVQFFKGAVKSA